MKVIHDYRMSVTISMDIMKNGRQRLFNDVMKHNSTIFEGLHEYTSDNIRDLYFEAYEMEWLDSHWRELTEYLKQHNIEYRTSEQRDITLFFAKCFSKFISEFDDTSDLSRIASHELIRAKKASLDQMINFSADWEERSNKMRVELKKNKEHYKRLIENAKNQRRNDHGIS